MRKRALFGLAVVCCLLRLPPGDNRCAALLAQDDKPAVNQKDASRTNSIGIRLVLIQPGEFQMGSSNGEKEEQPRHTVRLTKPFYLAATEVTVGQFQKFVEATGFKSYAERDRKLGPRETGPKLTWRNPFYTQSVDDPVVHVAWSDAQAFCEWLSTKENQAYRLPSEAEWEYACRAGSTTNWCCGDDEANLREFAWYSVNKNPKETPRAVAQKKSNAWGLYDMHGNVREWCQDWYSQDYYTATPRENPMGPATGRYRVIRGGCYGDAAVYCRSAYREGRTPGFHRIYVGFRVARSVSD